MRPVDACSVRTGTEWRRGNADYKQIYDSCTYHYRYRLFQRQRKGDEQFSGGQRRR